MIFNENRQLEDITKISKSEMKEKLTDYYNCQSEEDKLKRQKLKEEKKQNQCTSLDIHHITNIENHKANIMKKNEIIALNLQRYSQFKEINHDDEKIKDYQNKCFSLASGAIIPQSIISHMEPISNHKDLSNSLEDIVPNVSKTEPNNEIKSSRLSKENNNKKKPNRKLKKISNTIKEEDGLPTFYRYYAFNPSKNYNIKETVSTIKRNVVSPTNFKDLASILQISKNEQLKTSKSVLDFNIKQSIEKKKILELDKMNKLKVLQSSIISNEKAHSDIKEKESIKKQMQVEYSHDLDLQNKVKQNKKLVNEKFKFYSDFRGFDLGKGLDRPNPITNPVNSYVFKHGGI